MQTLTIRVAQAVLTHGSAAHDVHTARWLGNATDARPIVLVHGLGGSYVNWQLLGPLLAAAPQVGDVWALDLAGFGRTHRHGVDGAHRGATLDAQLDLLVGFLATVAPGQAATVVGNSMGGLLAMRLAARHPQLVAELALINPAMPAPLIARPDPVVLLNFSLFAIPGVGERVLAWRQQKLTPEQQVEQTMQMCTARPDAVDRDLIASHVDMATYRRGLDYAHAAFLEAARDVVRGVTTGRAQFTRDVTNITAPTLYLQGAKDRLVRPAAGALLMRTRPDFQHVRYEDLGHIPMIEAPERVAADLLRLRTTSPTPPQLSKLDIGGGIPPQTSTLPGPQA